MIIMLNTLLYCGFCNVDNSKIILDCKQWKPGNPWDSKWKLSINLYISAAGDVTDVAEVLIRVCMAER